MLLLSLCAPQSLIDGNIADSAVQIAKEGIGPRWFDMQDSAQMDNWTDANILIQCKSMSNVSAVLTNPVYGNGDPVNALQEYVQTENPTNPWYYSRYWMGFRGILRWLFVFFDYYQIRRYLAVVFFTLLFGVFVSMIRNLDAKAGMLFAFSVLLVRPQVICGSLQFSCCFLIAFSAMLLIPWIHKHRQYETLFFMELGLLTMFFDFYTTPIITFGFPMTYLYLLRNREEASPQLGRIGKNAVVWLGSYVAMWLSKLMLTELFTPLPAFEKAFQSASARLQLTESVESTETYSILNALTEVAKVLAADFTGAMVWGLGILLLAAAVAIKAARGKINWSVWRHDAGLLVLAVLPILWFSVAAQPTVIHAWFQYRGIVITLWASGLFYFRLMNGKKKGFSEK